MTTTVRTLDKDQLGDFLTHVLDTAVRFLERNDIPVPDRRIISHTDPPADCCDLLAVSYEFGKPTTQAPLPQFAGLQCAARTAISITVTIMRCAPSLHDGTSVAAVTPTAEELSNSALELAQDAWVLFEEFLEALVRGTIFNDCDNCCQNGGCQVTSFAGVNPISPRGGCAGNRLTFSVTMDPVRS